MASPPKNHVVEAPRAADSDNAKAAAPTTKVSTAPSPLEPRAGQFADQPYSDSQPSRWSGLFSRMLYWLAWLVTLSLIVVALLRVFYHDGTYFLTCVDAFTRYVYLPAYFCLIWATWKRRWFLAAANLALVGLHVALIEPDFVRDRRFDSVASSTAIDAPTAPNFRIFFANVRALNTEHQALLEEIKAANPDVIVLVEFSWLWHMAYLHSPVFAEYPYGGGMENARLGTVNVFSKIPLKSDKQNWFGGRGLQTIELPVGSETLHLIGLHAPRPMNIRNDDYAGFWESTIPMIQAESGPLVVVGDFNATQYSNVYEKLTADRLRSAHHDRGRGYVTTWPNGQYGVPSLIRIDQALLSPEIECVDIREGEGRGSDHKPLILDIKIRPKT